MASPTVIAAAVVGAAVVVSSTVLGGVLGSNASKNADAMIESSRIQALSQLKQVEEQQDTEKKRVLSEKQQADSWLAFDYNESRVDRAEAIQFQKRMDNLMDVNQSERYIGQASSRSHGYSDHSYPPLAAAA